MTWRLVALMGAAVLATLGAYGAMWDAGWVYEDPHNRLSALQWTGALRSRALTLWTWQWADTPRLAHALNLGIHGAVALLAAGLSRRLGLSWLAAVAVGIFVLVHPLATEAVAYASGRADALATLGVLLACLAATWASPWRWVGVAAGVGVGLLAKEIAIVALVLVPAVIWLRRVPVGRQTWGWLLVTGWLLVLVGGEVMSFGGIGVRGVVNRDTYSDQIAAMDWARTQSTAAVRLVGVTATGTGMTLDYDYDRVAGIWRSLSVVGLLGIAGLLWTLRRAPAVAFGLLMLLSIVGLRLVIQTPRGYLNEHHFYGAMVGLMVVVGAGIHALAYGWTGLTQTRST